MKEVNTEGQSVKPSHCKCLVSSSQCDQIPKIKITARKASEMTTFKRWLEVNIML